MDCRASVLTVSGHKDVVVGFETLAHSMRARSPFVDPLNVIQAELLKRYRNLQKKADVEGGQWPQELEKERQTVINALQICITGIAQGMRNSG